MIFDEKTGNEKEVDEKERKEITQSIVDPESGMFHKGEKERCFAYSQHAICDHHGFVIAVKTFPGNMHDSVTFFETYESIPEEIRENIHQIALDAGYKTPGIARFLEKREVIAYLPYKRPMTKKGYFKKSEYEYDAEKNQYICPNGEVMKYTTTNRTGYNEYKSDPKKCENCPLINQCTQSKNHTKLIQRHVWQEYLDHAEEMRKTAQWKSHYKNRKETIEKVFAENKEYHNLRYTRVRGLEKNQFQATMIFACHNLMKMARRKWDIKEMQEKKWEEMAKK
ncbi:IS1182 family transposase [uncultured Dubosiella sp.]|uniref:IS1182 family transposase n=1 Tax=uncultured Dubosiella sp. TaxID=1937011 RepID=UPI0025B579AF|nr:IS1182 family transposase [uncultured Dubosiella sp.]